MIDQNDIQKLIDLPIEGVAKRLGLIVKRHFSLCPFHDDQRPSLHFNTSKNRYRCYVCGAHGRTIDLVANHLNLKFADACKWLADEHNVILSEWQPADKPQTPKHTFDASKYLRFFDRPFLNEAARTFLFDQRKLDPRVVSWCRLNSFTDKQGTSWLQIPYYDIDGHLIGVQSRNLSYQSSSINNQSSSAPRFKFPYGHTCHIYNLPVLKLLKKGEPLFITEGASDCWAMLSAGYKAIAIPSATLLKEKDIEPLRGLNLHIFPDNDAPGEHLFLTLREKLSSSAGGVGGELTRHQLPAGCKDFAEAYIQLRSGMEGGKCLPQQA